MIERNVHHQGKIPSRTCIVAPAFSAVKGTWAACFETWAGTPGAERRMVSVQSGSHFATEDDAYAAAARALDTLQATDKYPNMCEPF